MRLHNSHSYVPKVQFDVCSCSRSKQEVCVCSGALHQRSHTLRSFYAQTDNFLLRPFSFQQLQRHANTCPTANTPGTPMPSSDWLLLRQHLHRKSNKAKRTDLLRLSLKLCRHGHNHQKVFMSKPGPGLWSRSSNRQNRQSHVCEFPPIVKHTGSYLKA